MDTEEKNPKNWYIRLKEDFFDTKEMKILKNMDNGKDYIILLLQLRLLTINTKGKLQFNNALPYNEKMIADITNTNIDVVRSGIKALQVLNFITLLDDGILYMEEVKNLIGYSSKYAEQKAKYREKKSKMMGQNDRQKIGHCPTRDKEIKRLEIRDKELIVIYDDKNDKNDKYSMHDFLEELKEDHKTRFINTIMQYVIKRFNQKPAEEKAQINNIPNYIKSAILQNIQILQSRSELSDDLYSEEYLEELLNKKD